MANLTMVKHGLFAVHDTGAPSGKSDYVTLVLLHGFAWHAGIFNHFIPLSEKNNTRVVLVNRRDYPGSTPFDEEDLRQLSSILPNAPTPETKKVVQDYMKLRSEELYRFLEGFVVSEKIPEKGGLVVAGWSFGAVWITALLANASSFSRGDVNLASYIRRLVLYDPPYVFLGYPPPPNSYNPLFDPSLAPGEGAKLFPLWVSGYYSHGDSPSELEHRNALSTPRATIATMSPEEIGSALYSPPGIPGGSDDTLLHTGIKNGLYAYLKDAILYPKEVESSGSESSDDWSSVELRYIWCDQSVWEMRWGTWAFQAELDEAKKLKKRTKQIQLIRLHGANHFAHWDQPERVFKALVDDDASE